MSTVTLGTATTTKLTALSFSPANADADIATIVAAIKGDSGPSSAPVGSGYLMPGPWSRIGTLYFPGRLGFVQLLPGDYIGVGPSSGWPIIVSGAAAASSDWSHS